MSTKFTLKAVAGDRIRLATNKDPPQTLLTPKEDFPQTIMVPRKVPPQRPMTPQKDSPQTPMVPKEGPLQTLMTTRKDAPQTLLTPKTDTPQTLLAPEKYPRRRLYFFDLPAELRNMICKLHLTQTEPIRLVDHKRPGKCSLPKPRLGVNLLLTCRQIHAEGVGFLYRDNVFCILPRLGAVDEHVYGVLSYCNLDYRVVGENPQANPSDCIERMGSANRANIRRVEIFLPPAICPHHLLPMRQWLPNLESLTFVLSWEDAHRYHDKFPGFARFCSQLVTVIPSVRTSRFDFDPAIQGAVTGLDMKFVKVIRNVRTAFKSIHRKALPLHDSLLGRFIKHEWHSRYPISGFEDENVEEYGGMEEEYDEDPTQYDIPMPSPVYEDPYGYL